MKRTANEVMTKTVVVVDEGAPYKDIVRLLEEHGLNAVPVVNDGGALVGIVSEADLLLKEQFAGDEGHWMEGRRRRVERAKARGLCARDVMTSPVVTAAPDATLGTMARLLHDRNVKQVPITGPGGKVVGIVSRKDLLRVFLRTDEDIRTEILDEIVARTLWMDRSLIRVKVRDGVATLEGEVEQRSLAEWLIELVQKLDGVVGVVDRLRYRDDERDRSSKPALSGSGYAFGWRPV